MQKSMVSLQTTEGFQCISQSIIYETPHRTVNQPQSGKLQENIEQKVK